MAEGFPVIPHEDLVRRVIRDEVGIEDGGRTPADAIPDLVAPPAAYDQAYETALEGKLNSILAALRTHGIVTDPNAPVDDDATQDAAEPNPDQTSQYLVDGLTPSQQAARPAAVVNIP